MSIDWFRSWHGAPTDTKWLSIARRADVGVDRVICIVWALMDCASQAQQRGDVSSYDAEAFSDFTGIPVLEINAVIDALHNKGILSENRFVAWDKRQPKRERKQDISTERVRAFRERQRQATPGNARQRLDKDKDKDKDKDTEKEKKRERGAALAPTWAPSENHFSQASELGFSRSEVEGMAEDMRLWATAKGETKKNWDAAFSGWMRREKKNGHSRGHGPPAKSRTMAAGERLMEKIRNGNFGNGEHGIRSGDSAGSRPQLPDATARPRQLPRPVDDRPDGLSDGGSS